MKTVRSAVETHKAAIKLNISDDIPFLTLEHEIRVLNQCEPMSCFTISVYMLLPSSCYINKSQKIRTDCSLLGHFLGIIWKLGAMGRCGQLSTFNYTFKHEDSDEKDVKPMWHLSETPETPELGLLNSVMREAIVAAIDVEEKQDNLLTKNATLNGLLFYSN